MLVDFLSLERKIEIVEKLTTEDFAKMPADKRFKYLCDSFEKTDMDLFKKVLPVCKDLLNTHCLPGNDRLMHPIIFWEEIFL